MFAELVDRGVVEVVGIDFNLAEQGSARDLDLDARVHRTMIFTLRFEFPVQR